MAQSDQIDPEVRRRLMQVAGGKSFTSLPMYPNGNSAFLPSTNTNKAGNLNATMTSTTPISAFPNASQQPFNAQQKAQVQPNQRGCSCRHNRSRQTCNRINRNRRLADSLGMAGRVGCQPLRHSWEFLRNKPNSRRNRNRLRSPRGRWFSVGGPQASCLHFYRIRYSRRCLPFGRNSRHLGVIIIKIEIRAINLFRLGRDLQASHKHPRSLSQQPRRHRSRSRVRFRKSSRPIPQPRNHSRTTTRDQEG